MTTSFRTALAMALLGLALLLRVHSVAADVLSFTEADAWIAAVRGFSTVDFVGFPDGAEVTDQYADLGVLFTPGANFALESPDWPDGGGLLGNGFGDISFEFIEPQLWIAVDYPGEVGFTLLLDGELVFETATTFNAPPAQFAFAGLVSTEPFNEVLIWDPGDQVFIDNLYFGSAEGGPDVNGDGVVDVLDLIAVLLAWGTDDSAADVNNDGTVDVADLVEVISDWS